MRLYRVALNGTTAGMPTSYFIGTCGRIRSVHVAVGVVPPAGHKSFPGRALSVGRRLEPDFCPAGGTAPPATLGLSRPPGRRRAGRLTYPARRERPLRCTDSPMNGVVRPPPGLSADQRALRALARGHQLGDLGGVQPRTLLRLSLLPCRPDVVRPADESAGGLALPPLVSRRVPALRVRDECPGFDSRRLRWQTTPGW